MTKPGEEFTPLLPLAPGRGGFKAAVCLGVFCLHNAFNCWMFLNFTNFAPAEQLLGADAQQVAFITTAGWLEFE